MKDAPKVITLLDPWVTLIARGVKTTFCQHYQPLHRGLLFLQAHGEPPRWTLGLCRQEPFYAVLRKLKAITDDGLQTSPGCVVSAVNLVAVHTRGRAPDLWKQNQAYGDAKPGSWLWEVADAFALPEPVPLTGRPGIRDLEPAVLALALAQLPAGRFPIGTAPAGPGA